MQHEQLRYKYLANMGVDRWSLKVLPFAAICRNANHQEILLMAEGADQSNQQQVVLWGNMLNALKRFNVSVKTLSFVEYHAMDVSTMTTCVLGGDAPTLADLVKQPKLKSDVWQTLKKMLSI